MLGASWGAWVLGSWGTAFGVAVLGRRWPGQPRLPRGPPCAKGHDVPSQIVGAPLA